MKDRLRYALWTWNVFWAFLLLYVLVYGTVSLNAVLGA